MPTVLSRQTLTPTSKLPKVEYRNLKGEWVSDASLDVEIGDFLALDSEALKLTKETGIWHCAKVLPKDRLQPFTDVQTKLPI